jgi:hypothetical protein
MEIIMTDRPNRKRALRCETVIAGYGDDLVESNLIDLLADAMHWCDYRREDFHYILARACCHYIRELNDEHCDERRMIP